MSIQVRWLACNLQSGKLIEELPDLVPAAPLSSILATYTSCAFDLPISTAPRDWEAAVQEGQTMIVAMLSDAPVWAGAVLAMEVGTSETATLGCVSLEGYLDHRYVSDHVWEQQDEASVIAAGLIGDANVEGIGLTVDAPATGTLRDRTYEDKSDKTVYSAMRELMGVMEGPEWTIGLSWDNATQTITKTLRVRSRIGVASAIPGAVFDNKPAAVFDTLGASSTEYTLSRDWSSGKGANHVVAVSSGQGDSRPQSEPARDVRTGWARWEHRWTPSTSITNVDTLNAHAQRTLEVMAYGARTLSIKARADTYPMLGRDWELGDDIGYDLVGPAHPEGLSGSARAIGWKLDPRAGVVEPILLLPGGSIGGI